LWVLGGVGIVDARDADDGTAPAAEDERGVRVSDRGVSPHMKSLPSIFIASREIS
jgi:hypothetical protein